MATLRNRKKIAAVIKSSQEEHPRNSLSRDTFVARVKEDYIAQVSDEIEERVDKKMSQGFRSLSMLDDLF